VSLASMTDVNTLFLVVVSDVSHVTSFKFRCCTVVWWLALRCGGRVTVLHGWRGHGITVHVASHLALHVIEMLMMLLLLFVSKSMRREAQKLVNNNAADDGMTNSTYKSGLGPIDPSSTIP